MSSEWDRRDYDHRDTYSDLIPRLSTLLYHLERVREENAEISRLREENRVLRAELKQLKHK